MDAHTKAAIDEIQAAINRQEDDLLRLQRALITHDGNLLALLCAVGALLETHPDRTAARAAFERAFASSQATLALSPLRPGTGPAPEAKAAYEALLAKASTR